jgi:Mg2+-importing ATPase
MPRHMSPSNSEVDIETFSFTPVDEAFLQLKSHRHGLTEEDSAARLLEYGKNVVSTKKPPNLLIIGARAFCGWFNILLLIVAIMSVASQPPDWSSFTIVMVILLIATCIQFFQDCAGTAAAIKLQAAVSTTVRVCRFESFESHQDVMIDQKHLVPGDIIYIDPGDTIPADCLLIEAYDLSIGQSGLTGESEPQRKSNSCPIAESSTDILELENILWAASNAISGHGRALVVKTGNGMQTPRCLGHTDSYCSQIPTLLKSQSS